MMNNYSITESRQGYNYTNHTFSEKKHTLAHYGTFSL